MLALAMHGFFLLKITKKGVQLENHEKKLNGLKGGNENKFVQIIKFRVVGGEMGATSSLAPKVFTKDTY
jgi:hypothetical protein